MISEWVPFFLPLVCSAAPRTMYVPSPICRSLQHTAICRPRELWCRYSLMPSLCSVTWFITQVLYRHAVFHSVWRNVYISWYLCHTIDMLIFFSWQRKYQNAAWESCHSSWLTVPQHTHTQTHTHTLNMGWIKNNHMDHRSSSDNWKKLPGVPSLYAKNHCTTLSLFQERGPANLRY